MKLEKDTWVLVANGEKFLLMRNNGDADVLDLRIIGHEEIDNPPTRAQGTDRPGRMPDDGHGRSAADDTDWHMLEKERFAADLAEKLRLWALTGRFPAMVLAADPRTLGILRPALHGEVRARIVAELNKDFTNLPLDEIEKHITAEP